MQMQQQSNTVHPIGPHLGQCIGSYRIVRMLGQGGMGAVYEAVNEKIGKQAAIKVLLPRFCQNKEIQRRFLNEARSVNKVRHPGLVDIYEFGNTPDNCAYIIMEYLDGLPLHAYLNEHRPVPVRKILGLAQQIAAALAAAHEKGVVHRDLKPANIIILKDPIIPCGERTKILDFGIAKMSAWLESGQSNPIQTMPGVLMGTPAYMAPEQWREVHHVTDRADVFSLGVILFQALSGELPFRPPFQPDGRRQLAEAPRRLREIGATVSPAVEALVESMMVHDPRSRPAMEQVERELMRLANEESPGPDFEELDISVSYTSDDSQMRHSWRNPNWRARLPWLAGGIATLAAILVLAQAIHHGRVRGPAGGHGATVRPVVPRPSPNVSKAPVLAAGGALPVRALPVAPPAVGPRPHLPRRAVRAPAKARPPEEFSNDQVERFE